MKLQRLLLLLCVLNTGLLIFWAAKPRQQVYEKITVREFEVVDKKGVPRLTVQTYDDGDVVLRMKDKKGEIRVKLEADDEGAGLVLLNGATEPVIHALAKKSTTPLTIIDKNGQKREF